MRRLLILALIAFAPAAFALDIVSPDGTGKELLARNWGSASRLIFYNGPNFSGRAIIANFNCSDVCNLDQVGIIYRASSLRVENGTWIFCSRTNLKGDCRTFGPGEYPELSPDLAPELDKHIMSVQRVPD
jgi:hypothetical protein